MNQAKLDELIGHSITTIEYNHDADNFQTEVNITTTNGVLNLLAYMKFHGGEPFKAVIKSNLFPLDYVNGDDKSTTD